MFINSSGSGGHGSNHSSEGNGGSMAKRRREIRSRLLEDGAGQGAALGVGAGGQGPIPAAKCKWTFVFDPAGRLCYYWSLVISLAFLYNFWVSSFNQVWSLIYRYGITQNYIIKL